MQIYYNSQSGPQYTSRRMMRLAEVLPAGSWFLVFLIAIGLLFSPVLQGQQNAALGKHYTDSVSVLSYVHPEIGTAQSRWFFFTPGAAPQGMAKLAPSTNGHYGNASGWEAVGYDPRDRTIEGFVLFHEWQLGGAMLTATNGPLYTKPGDSSDLVKKGYRSHYRHSTEVAEPGYYRVMLDDYGIKAELTATKRVGFLRFNFPKTNHGHPATGNRVLFVMGNKWGESGEVKDAMVRMVDATHFEGYVRTFPKYLDIFDRQGAVQMYIYGELSQPPVNAGSFTDNQVKAGSSSIKATGKGAGLYFDYPDDQGSRGAIEIKVGLSYTGIAGARNNLIAEAASLNFDQARQQVQSTWAQALGRIRVESRTEDLKIKFYTGLYHALLGRGVSCDANGDYPLAYQKQEGQHQGSLADRAPNGIGHIPRDKNGSGTLKFQMINTDAIWGAYWNLTQLWSLAYPKYLRDFAYTQLEMYKNRGWFADGLVNSQYASGVGTNFVGLVLAAAYQTGLFRDADSSELQLIYAAVRKNELGIRDQHGTRPAGAGKEDLAAFLKTGYVPYKDQQHSNAEGSNFAASHTLEYCFGAYAASQLALGLNKEKDALLFKQYANGWKKIFDSSLKLIRPKDSNGNFIKDYDPYEPWRGFQEGNGMQYSFFVPGDPYGLIKRVGRDLFNDRLLKIFSAAEKDAFSGGRTMDAFSGVKAGYNQGNQPDMHMSWLFNFSGEPWQTQHWTRAIIDRFYGTDSIHGYGFGQDEDQGQLGGWLVMTSLGLFDVKGFTDRRPLIEIGSPVFDKATILLGNNHELIIQTKNNNRINRYIQSASFNGKPLNKCWLYRDELVQGGVLQLTMGPRPNTAWGVKNPPPNEAP